MMSKKLTLLLLALSALLTACTNTFTTMAMRPDGTTLALVSSQAEIMNVSYDAIVSEFPADRIHAFPKDQREHALATEVGYRWRHFGGGTTGDYRLKFRRVIGDAKGHGNIMGWVFELSVPSNLENRDITHILNGLNYAFKHRDIKQAALRHVTFATTADMKAIKSFAIKQGSGTGFFVTTDGYLITNNHVIADANRIDVHASNGNIYRARVISKDPSNDVALLKVEAQTKPLRVHSAGKLEKGAEVFTLGYPMPDLEGNAVKATFGRVNALSGINDDIRYVQIDVPIQPGNSGGPLINDDGEVVGMTSASVNQGLVVNHTGTMAQNVNYAVKADYFLTLLKYAGVHLPKDKAVHDAIKNPSQFEPSVVQIVVSHQVSP